MFFSSAAYTGGGTHQVSLTDPWGVTKLAAWSVINQCILTGGKLLPENEDYKYTMLVPSALHSCMSDPPKSHVPIS